MHGGAKRGGRSLLRELAKRITHPLEVDDAGAAVVAVGQMLAEEERLRRVKVVVL